jgi:hypothetical protein
MEKKNSQTPRSVAECAVPKERTELKEDNKRNSKKQNEIIKRKRNSDSLERRF